MSRLSAKYVELISGRRPGVFADILRAGLTALSLPYLGIITLRNARYRLLRRRIHRASCPVISVGNITVGGTGKTPFAAHIAQLLLDRERKVVLILRGYKGRPLHFDDDVRPETAAQWRLASDEAMVLKRLCPAAFVMINPDRVAAARRAVETGGDALVLDDGFQHRRLGRDLDVVLIDSTEPFGFGHLLPRGFLREPARSLRRAGLIIVTRADEIDDSTRSVLLATLRRISGNKPVIQAVHRVDGFVDIKGRPVENVDPAAMRAVIFAGIANFQSFQRCVEAMGVQVLAAYQYPDHHNYTTEEVDALPDVAANLDANVILTTEKDAVKLVGRWNDDIFRLLAIRLRIEFLGDGEAVLGQAIDGVLKQGGQTPPREIGK